MCVAPNIHAANPLVPADFGEDLFKTYGPTIQPNLGPFHINFGRAFLAVAAIKFVNDLLADLVNALD
jgi:hypothetical protein